MGYSNPSVQDFKTYFARAFPFGANPAEEITDDDITRAFQTTNAFINASFFSDQGTYTIGYLNLAAHYLVTSINLSGLGLTMGGVGGVESSKSVGSVSVSYQIPDMYLKNPFYAALARTGYGLVYFDMIAPYLIGRMTYVRGSTRP
jgi:hypothetical protein